MDPERWTRLEALCADAWELAPGERLAFLDSGCAGDADLRREAEELLARLDRQPDFLALPLVDLSDLGTPDPDDTGPAETAIGPWRLIRRLGRGGMGDVYLAEREAEDVRQQVALKLIRRGMDSDEVVRRFRLERRILASLHHPNIAALLDAGASDDGRPWVVMEYVEGMPVDRYCDGRKLSLEQRLRLLLVICAAVQHAHQNLVVHRDLKPRNILVTADGTPKLLDFGIGKVLASSGTLGPDVETRTLVRLLTPEFAAPEQLAGEAVTTATDVYGLGVLMYVLLTGRHPLLDGGESLAQVEEAVRGRDPLRPSDVAGPEGRRRLAGDLDTIILKALRKEPARRYPSAAALADDIRRYLDRRPVLARPDTLRYRTGRFMRRNAGWVAAGAFAGLGLVATAGVTLVQSRRVGREVERVLHERDKAFEVRSFLMEMFGATGADRAAGDTVTARTLLDLQAASLATAYADRPELRAAMMEVLADGYDRLGLYQRAEPLAREALELRRQVLPVGDPDLASSLNMYGWIVHELGRSGEAAPLLQEAVAIRRAAGPRFRLDLSRSLNDLGVVLNSLSRWSEAESALDEALAIRREALGDGHRSVGITANNLAAAHYYQARLDQAVEVQHLALRALEQAVGPDHQRTVVALTNLATFRRAGGDRTGAVRDYRDLLQRQVRIQGSDHPIAARTMTGLAAMLLESATTGGDRSGLDEAERLCRDALGILETHLGASHPQVGIALDRLAAIRTELGDMTEALALAERALAIMQQTYQRDDPTVAGVLARLATIHGRLGRPDRASTLQAEALRMLDATAGPAHPDAIRAVVTLCELRVASGDMDDAEVQCERAARSLGERSEGAPPLVRVLLARVHYARGRAAAGDSLVALARASVASGAGGTAARRMLDSLDLAMGTKQDRR